MKTPNLVRNYLALLAASFAATVLMSACGPSAEQPKKEEPAKAEHPKSEHPK